MKKLFYATAPLTAALLIYGFAQAWFIAPTEATMGDIYRIFYYHFAFANLMFLFLLMSLIGSVGYLVQRRRNPLNALGWDAFALANAEIGTLFCGTVLVQGMLWARPVWGIWWTWDARLTSTLVLFLIYLSYLLLRRFSLTGQTQTLAAVLAIFGYLDVPIVYMSIRWWRTQHPSPVISGSGHLDPAMWVALLWNVAAWLAWGLTVMLLRFDGLRREERAREARALAALETSLEINQ